MTMQYTRLYPAICCLIISGTHFSSTGSADDDVWKVIPHEAHAISVVRDMESFSDKIDHVAHTMNFQQPHVLKSAMAQSGIREGLDLSGNLAWVVRPMAGANGEPTSGTLYLLPASDFDKLIKPLIPNPNAAKNKLKPIKANAAKGNPRSVSIVSRAAFVAELGSSAAFAFEADRNALTESIDFGPNILTEIEPLKAFLSKQDVYVIVTHAGLANGLKDFGLPLSDSNIYVDLVFAGVREAAMTTFAKSLNIRQLAMGTAIDPAKGASVSSRLVTGQNADLSLFFPKQPIGRDDALNRLPNAPLAFAVGGPISPERNQQVTLELQDQLRRYATNPDNRFAPEAIEKWKTLIDRIRIDVRGIQLGVFPSEPPDVAADPDLDLAILDLARSVILVLKVENSKASLGEIADWINAIPEPNAEPFLNGFPCAVRPLARGDLDGMPVVRASLDKLPEDVPKSLPRLMIAAPDHHTLVVTVGSDAELKRALQPFRKDGTNLMQSPPVRSSVQMLPESASWVAVINAKTSLALAIKTLYQPGPDMTVLEQLGSSLPDASPLAAGVSWKRPMLDVTLAAQNDLLAAIGELTGSLFHVPKPKVKPKK